MGSHELVHKYSKIENNHVDDPASETRAVLDSLRRIVRSLRLSSRQTKRTSGLPIAQVFVLQKLAESKATSIAELATRTCTDPSSVSVVVSRLVSKRLVTRKSSKGDRRRIELSLTASGQAALAKSVLPAQGCLIAAIDKLSAQERVGLATSLAKIVETIGMTDQPASLFFEDEIEKPPREPMTS